MTMKGQPSSVQSPQSCQLFEGTGVAWIGRVCAGSGARLEAPRQEAGQSVRFSELSLETWGPAGFRIHSHVTLRPQPGPLETSMFPSVSEVAQR